MTNQAVGGLSGAGATKAGGDSTGVGGKGGGGGSLAVGGQSAVGGSSSVAGSWTTAGSSGFAGSSTSVPTYSVSGKVSGLLGTGLMLQLNGVTDLAATADGTFIFPTAFNDGAPYAVTIRAQPTDPAQTCVIRNGTGQIAGANVSNMSVRCPLRARYYLVVDSVDNSVSSYAIDGGSGRSTFVGRATTGISSPASLAVDPTGTYAYVANSGSGTISQYQIGIDGSLTEA